MRKKREFTIGTYYHVTSRTNDKIRVFENKLGRKITLITLQDAKDKFRFRLANFCIMPTHIHLLIEPGEGTNLSLIMQWLKPAPQNAGIEYMNHQITYGQPLFCKNHKKPSRI
jgi:putative transposase